MVDQKLIIVMIILVGLILALQNLTVVYLMKKIKNALKVEMSTLTLVIALIVHVVHAVRCLVIRFISRTEYSLIRLLGGVKINENIDKSLTEIPDQSLISCIDEPNWRSNTISDITCDNFTDASGLPNVAACLKYGREKSVLGVYASTACCA